jgi:hypothetical protein
VNLLVLARFFSREAGTGWFDRELGKEILSSSAAAVLMLAATVSLANGVDWMELPTIRRALYLVGCVGIGIGVYSVAAWFFGCKGMKTLKNKLLER